MEQAKWEIRVMSDEEVKTITNLSRVTRWRMEREGTFPQRIKLTEHRVGWRYDEVMAWLESPDRR